MDDDRLASELQRRASGASPRPDWAQRDLLPGVWHEIDARPVPVVTSRWSPGWSVAAVIAALLILVVAVPRLVPQPPSATSTPSNPLVLSSADFAALLAAGSLNGQTVLVDGAIATAAGPAQPMPSCSMPTGCYMGELWGSDPPISVAAPLTRTTDRAHAIYVESGVAPDGWMFWRAARPAVQGTLLLAVANDGSVQFMGIPRAGPAARVWSVADAAALDINSIGPDEVVLVDGWLGETVGMLCRAPSGPREPSLPSRYCSDEWIASEATSTAGIQLQVQAGAYSEFASNLTTQGSHVPLRGVYAVAPRLEGWCASGNPPCWQWNVVARVDEVTPTTPEATPTSTPQGPRQIPCDLVAPVVVDETGLVTECKGSTTMPADGAALTVSNAAGDQTRLVVSWAEACSGVDELALRRSDESYELVVSSIDLGYVCDGVPIEYRVELQLSTPVPAGTVTIRYQAHPPIPTAGASECQWQGWNDPQSTEGSPEPAPSLLLPPPTFIDETGLVVSCVSFDRPWDIFPTLVIDPVNDLGTRYNINWTTTVCDTASTVTFARAGERFSVEIDRGRTAGHCDQVSKRQIRIELREPIDDGLIDLVPEPTPSPSPHEPGERTLDCVGSEALGDPGITLIDHSGRIGACSMAQADLIPERPIEVSTTGLPGQLVVDWTVNTGCPADETIEFWGPTDQSLGLAGYVLQLARREIPGEQCSDLVAVRRVELGFTVMVRPSDILPFIVDESTAEARISQQASVVTNAGRFTLLLSGALDGYAANTPIDVAPRLTFEGEDKVTLSGGWRPDFTFDSLSGGPSFERYGSDLMCPDIEAQLAAGDSVTGTLPHPPSTAEGDPNYAYFNEFSPDGLFRLPEGTYLISAGVSFSVGGDCQGEAVRLWSAIVIHVR